MISFRINVHMQNTTIDVQFRQKNELSVSKHPNILLLKREKKKDVDKAETSYDLTITVKLLTVNPAHRLRKIPYTKVKVSFIPLAT